MKLTKILALVLVFAMVACMFVGCKDKDSNDPTGSDSKNETPLVVGYSYFSSKFSPFFSTTAYDTDVYEMTQVGLIGSDREGNMILKGIEGETVPYNGTDYTYTGIADTEVVQNEDGSVDYNFTLRDDVLFADGEKLTADDVIFSMYVLCDPTYDGASTLYAQPIEGMEDYRSGMSKKGELIMAGGRDGESEYYTAEERDEYWAAIDQAGVKLVEGIVSNIQNALGAEECSVYTALENWGFADAITDENMTAEDGWALILAAYENDPAAANAEAGDVDLFDALVEVLGDKASVYDEGIETGSSAANISGIKKIDDTHVSVHMTEFDATSIYQLSLAVAPMHYYGDASKYDYDNNQFGFTKGDLSGVKSKNAAPMGAGPYKFKSFEKGVVSFEANENYFKGCPKTKNVLFQETSEGDKLTGVATGTFDITDPSFDQSVVEAVKGYNSNGELDGDKITTNCVDNLGYGYLGINANLVKVGDDSSSQQSKDLRKAFATVLAVYRDVVIDSYYGERASVINYPISNTSWAAPKPADEGYEIAYSKDVDGNPIYTADMTADEKYEAALNAAIGFFKAAGYTFDEASGKFTAAPEGASLEYTFTIPADGTGNHPAYGILTEAQNALETIGIKMDINDLSDSNQLWNGLEAGTVEMWTAAWQSTVDPDMYQVYFSENTPENNGGSNNYHVQDKELDRLMMEARTSADQAFRKATYKECLNIILDWAVEIPAYQRQNAYVFSTERVNMATMTPDITTFYDWSAEIENIEMN